jgi:hypothetical protein
VALAQEATVCWCGARPGEHFRRSCSQMPSVPAGQGLLWQREHSPPALERPLCQFPDRRGPEPREPVGHLVNFLNIRRGPGALLALRWQCLRRRLAKEARQQPRVGERAARAENPAARRKRPMPVGRMISRRRTRREQHPAQCRGSRRGLAPMRCVSFCLIHDTDLPMAWSKFGDGAKCPRRLHCPAIHRVG